MISLIGFTELAWTKYAGNIREKFDLLNKLIEENRIKLKYNKKVLNYIFNLPSDFGGVSEVFEDNKYENLNIFEKMNKNRSFPNIDIKQGIVYVPLENHNEGNISNNILNNNINLINPNSTPANMPNPFAMMLRHQMMLNQFLSRGAGQSTENDQNGSNNNDLKITHINQFSPYININAINGLNKDEKLSKKKSKKEKSSKSILLIFFI